MVGIHHLLGDTDNVGVVDTDLAQQLEVVLLIHLLVDKVVEGLGALAQAAGVALQLSGKGFQGLEFLLPGLIGGVEVGGVPGILLRDGIRWGMDFCFDIGNLLICEAAAPAFLIVW